MTILQGVFHNEINVTLQTKTIDCFLCHLTWVNINCSQNTKPVPA